MDDLSRIPRLLWSRILPIAFVSLFGGCTSVGERSRTPEANPTSHEQPSRGDSLAACAKDDSDACLAAARGAFRKHRLPDRIGRDLLVWTCKRYPSTCRRAGRLFSTDLSGIRTRMKSRTPQVPVDHWFYRTGCRHGDLGSCRSAARVADRARSAARFANAVCRRKSPTVLCARLRALGWQSDIVRDVARVDRNERNNPWLEGSPGPRGWFDPVSSRPILLGSEHLYTAEPVANARSPSTPAWEVGTSWRYLPARSRLKTSEWRTFSSGAVYLMYGTHRAMFVSDLRGSGTNQLHAGDERRICRIHDVAPTRDQVLAASAPTDDCEKRRLGWWDLDDGKPTGVSQSFEDGPPATRLHHAADAETIVGMSAGGELSVRDPQTLETIASYDVDAEFDVGDVWTTSSSKAVYATFKEYNTRHPKVWRITRSGHEAIFEGAAGTLEMVDDGELLAVVSPRALHWLDPETGTRLGRPTRLSFKRPKEVDVVRGPKGCRLLVTGTKTPTPSDSGVRIVEIDRGGRCDGSSPGAVPSLSERYERIPEETVEPRTDGVVRGRVTIEGREAPAGTELHLERFNERAGEYEQRTVETDGTGRFEADGLHHGGVVRGRWHAELCSLPWPPDDSEGRGSRESTMRAPVFPSDASGYRNRYALRVDSDPKREHLAYSYRGIKGRITMPNGEPAGDVTVIYVPNAFTGRAKGQFTHEEELPVADVTDAKGRYELFGALIGRYENPNGILVAFSSSGAFAKRRLSSGDGNDDGMTRIALQLEDRTTIAARVRGRSGENLHRFSPTPWRLERPVRVGSRAPEQSSFQFTPWPAGPRGLWVAPVESPGSYRVRALHPRRTLRERDAGAKPPTAYAKRSSFTTEVRAMRPRTPTIQLPDGRLTISHPTRKKIGDHRSDTCRGSSRWDRDPYVSKYEILARPVSNGESSRVHPPDQWYFPTRRSERGSHLELLEGGKWVVVGIGPDRERWARRTVTLQPGGSNTVDLDFQKPTRSVEGDVVSARTGLPLPERHVIVKPLVQESSNEYPKSEQDNPTDLPEIETRTGPNGHFSLDGLPPIALEIRVDRGWEAWRRREVPVSDRRRALPSSAPRTRMMKEPVTPYRVRTLWVPAPPESSSADNPYALDRIPLRRSEP